MYQPNINLSKYVDLPNRIENIQDFESPGSKQVKTNDDGLDLGVIIITYCS